MLEISAACHRHGKVPSHNVSTDVRHPERAGEDARRARESSATCASGASTRAVEPIVAAFRPERREIGAASEILLAAYDNSWAPIRHRDQLHDRASYRYYWSLLQRAHATGADLPERVQSCSSPDPARARRLATSPIPQEDSKNRDTDGQSQGGSTDQRGERTCQPRLRTRRRHGGPGRAEAQKSVVPVRRDRRQHRAVHGRPQRQRPALPRLRHPRHRRCLRIRGDRPPAGARQAAHQGRAARLQDQAQGPARPARQRQGRPRMGARQRPPDGRDAHRRVRARHRAAREGRPQHPRRARHRRPPDGQPRLDAAVLVPLQPQRPPHRGRDRRRLHRRPLPAPAARREALGPVGARHAHLADPVRGARVQRLDLHRPRHRRHRLGHVLVDLRRHRRAARPKHGGANEVAFEIQKRYDTPTRPRPTSRAAWRTRKW